MRRLRWAPRDTIEVRIECPDGTLIKERVQFRQELALHPTLSFGPDSDAEGVVKFIKPYIVTVRP